MPDGRFRALARVGGLRARPGLGLVLACATYAAALALRFWLDPSLPPGFPYLTFFPAVMVTAFLAGWRPAAVCALLCGVSAWWWFLPPPQAFTLDGPTALALTFYAVIVVVDISLIELMHTAVRQLAAEQARTAELAENRALLFRELEHRVANNLQVVSALLSLEERRLGDEAARRALAQARSRLELIGKIQRRLHDSAAAAQGPAGFAEELCRDALDAAGAQKVTMTVRADEHPLHPDQAASVFLIMLECVNNALEHAFPHGEGGRLAVELRSGTDGMRELTVRDDGVGPPADFSLDRSGSLGLQIVRALTAQLGGRFEVIRDGGALSRLTFPAAPPSFSRSE